MRAMESTRRKLYASEEKYSWSQSDPEVMMCHQKQVHQKHLIRRRITRSWSSSEDERLKSSKPVKRI